jgi:hypothetical protein
VDVDAAFEDDVLIEALEDRIALDIVELEVELALEELELLVPAKGVASCTSQKCG